MLNTRTLSTIAAVGLLILAMLPAEADDLAAVRERIAAEFDIIGPEHVSPSPVEGWYTIQKGTIVAYVSGDARYLLQGDLIDLDAQTNLTELARDEARKSMVAGLGDDEVITFAPEEVKYEVTVFTDVGCTFCRRMHSEIDKYLAAGIAVRYVLYPRNGPESPDWIESEKVWCASDRKSALTAAKQDRPFPTSECDASIVQDHYLLGRDVGLSGTPAIVLEDGTLIAGYMPPDMLAEQLAEAEAEAEDAEPDQAAARK
jgi:thiol:disulfide interchange protein DsbC